VGNQYPSPRSNLTPSTPHCVLPARQAEAFKKNLFPSIERTYGSYAELAADPDVDIVYIGTVHNFHSEHSLLMIAHGKHVLCEKPVAMNAKQAVVMIEAARAKKVFFLEG
jgi:predicted dehydrogenase